MATFTPERISGNSGISEAPTQGSKSKPNGGPVARLLAKVSQMHGEYVEYQMDAGVWRKLAL